MDILTIVIGLVALVIGILVGIMVNKMIASKSKSNAEIQAKNIILSAENEAKNLIKEKTLEAKEEASKIKIDAETEVKERLIDVKQKENRVTQKEETLEKKLYSADKRHEELDAKVKEIEQRKQKVEQIINEQNTLLEKVAGLSKEEAKQELLKNLESELVTEKATLIKRYEEEINEESEKKAQEIISSAIQRTAQDHITENTISVISIPSDDVKGRLIGREGRNIRTFEQVTGVDLQIDDTPEAITISSMDPIRRAVASLALQKLVTDGRIQPTRIEECVNIAKKEIKNAAKSAAENACYETNVHNLHPELLKLLGTLKYRTSYGQNVLIHSMEVAHLAGLMASEIGLDPKVAKRAGLLHDIGKALDHSVEGSHVDIGIDVLQKYKESNDVIIGMKSHHGDYPNESLESILVQAADALSAARPGARSEILDSYVKRIQRLEVLVSEIKGVKKAYAIQAGREIRIIANPDEVTDDGIVLLARDIAGKIEGELKYPGQIKVNVIRETAAVDYAK